MYNIAMDALVSFAKPVSISRQRILVAGLHLFTFVLLGLHLYVRSLPPTPTAMPAPESAETVWWGLWPVHYVPGWMVIAAASAVVGLMIWLGFRGRTTSFPVVSKRQERLILCAVFVVLWAAFVFWPIVHTRWGDAYMLSRAISWPDPVLRLTHSWQAPLDVFVHSQLWLWLREPLLWADAVPVYRLLSPLAGALYLLAVAALCRDEGLAPPWLTAGLLCTLGLMQLFFGYVENYSFAAAGVLAYLWLGLGVIREERPLWQAALLLALTNATHPSTIILALSLLYCGWYGWQTGNKSVRSVVYQIGLPMIGVAAATIALMEAGGHGLTALFTSDRPGGGDARLFVPLFATTTRWEHYTLFSWLHLRDFLNEQLLVAPVVLPGLALVSLSWINQNQEDVRSGSRDSALRASHSASIFLALAAAAYLLFTWVWNPDYGGQRDWDLFSLAALPLTLLFVHLLARALPNRRMLATCGLPLIVVQGLHSAAWIYQNTLPWSWPP